MFTNMLPTGDLFHFRRVYDYFIIIARHCEESIAR
jgi:hypothetical protein